MCSRQPDSQCTHTHTHTHTPGHTRTQSHNLTHTHLDTHTQSQNITHTHVRTHKQSQNLTHTHTWTHTFTKSHTHCHITTDHHFNIAKPIHTYTQHSTLLDKLIVFLLWQIILSKNIQRKTKQFTVNRFIYVSKLPYSKVNVWPFLCHGGVRKWLQQVVGSLIDIKLNVCISFLCFQQSTIGHFVLLCEPMNSRWVWGAQAVQW